MTPLPASKKRFLLPSSQGSSAFTLVELLVVIGIIAVLIGILLPVMGAARRKAEVAQCLAVERQIGFACLNFSTVHNGYYPTAGDFGNQTTSVLTPEALGDANQRKYAYLGVNGDGLEGTTLAPWQAALAPYMGKKSAMDGGSNADLAVDEIGIRSYLKYFLCPSHQAVAGDVPESIVYCTNQMAWMIQQSYVLNEAVFGINPTMKRLAGQASRIRHPAATVLIAEGVAGNVRGALTTGGNNGTNWTGKGWITFTNYVSGDPVNLPITLADALTVPVAPKYGIAFARAGDPKNFDKIRHKGKIDILFADFHAETRLITPGDLKDACLLSK